MNVVALAQRRAAAVFLLLVALAAGGVLVALRLPSSIFPQVTFPLVKVIADVGEVPAVRVIPTVTRPLEEAVARVPGIQTVRSITSRGSTEMSAEFSWGTEMQVALQRVQAEVERVRPQLPPDAAVDVEWMNTSIFPILGYALTSDRLAGWQLRQLAEYTLKPELLRIDGVSQVQVQGGREREIQIHLDLRALAGRHLTPNDVVDAVSKDHRILSAGLVERNHELYLALVDGRAGGLDTLPGLAIPVGPEAVPVPLGSIADLRAADAVSYVRTTAGGHEAVLLNVVQQPSANTVSIAAGVHRLLQDHPEIIPPGVQWSAFYDQARFITDSVRGVRDAILIGVGLAALVLLVFLRRWRPTLVTVVAIPLTVALVFVGLRATGMTLNLMTLGGIAAALGLVADDAIVVVENIHRHHEERDARHAALTGARELLPALVGSSLSTIVVFLPFALLSGVAGAFFQPLALTMVLALVSSFVIAAFAVPAAMRRAEPEGEERGRAEAESAGREEGPAEPAASQEVAQEREEGPGPSRLRRWSARAIALWPAAALLLVGLGVAGWLLYRAIDTDFLPAMDEGSIILDYRTPPGTSLSETDAMLRQAERVILSLPDVAGYSRRTGTELGFFVTEPNSGDYVIQLEPRGRRRPVEEVIDALRARLAAVEPAIETDFGQLLEDDIGDLSGGVPQPIEVKVFGEDQAQLQQAARRIAELITPIRGVEDVFDGITISGPALDLVTDSRELARHGLTTEDLQGQVEAALTGTVASDLRVGERVYDVRVFSSHHGPLAALPILDGEGVATRLDRLADVSTGPPEAEIDREDLRSYLAVTARLSGRSLGGAVSDIRRTLSRGLHLPSGLSVEYGGQYAQQQQSFKALLGVLLAGLLLVGVILLFEFGDWRAPLLTAAIALGVLPGVFAALVLTGQTLNISSFVGAIMVVGIVGENAIFIIHEGRLELARGLGVDAAWATAAHRRLRPVAMTVVATACALAPLALALGQGSQLLQPLAIAVIGGFVLSGPLVLWVLPALYARLDPRGRLAPRSPLREGES